MSTTLLSSPPPPHDPCVVALQSAPAGSTARIHGESRFTGGAGRRSVLPPLIPNRSPLGRSSSPRNHSAATNTRARQTSAFSQHPPLSPSFWQDLSSDPDFNFPAAWPDDTLAGPPRVNLTHDVDEQYISALTDDEHDRNLSTDFAALVEPESRSYNRNRLIDTAPPLPPARSTQPGPSRTDTQLTATTLDDSLETQLTDYFGEDAIPSSSQSSVSDAMPPTTRKRTATATREAQSGYKRRRTSAAELLAQNPITITDQDSDDVFGDSPPALTPADEPNSDELTTIDLTEANEVPEEFQQPIEDKRIKLSTFQCVICMDNVAALTVTHCGHLYCAQCLHSSMHVEATKGKCPMCRQKIDTRRRNEYNAKTKGYWHLELKFTTKTRKGKRKADSLS